MSAVRIIDLTHDPLPSPDDHLEIQKDDSGNESRRTSIREAVESMQAENIAEIGTTITDPPTQAEVQAVQDKLDALLAALKTAGLMEDDASS